MLKARLLLPLLIPCLVYSSSAIAQPAISYANRATRAINSAYAALKAGDRKLACSLMTESEILIESYHTQARLDLQASAQLAELDLEIARSQRHSLSSPASVNAVIGAQIDAAASRAAGRGILTEAEATRRLYEVRKEWMSIEHMVQQTQMSVQHAKQNAGCP